MGQEGGFGGFLDFWIYFLVVKLNMYCFVDCLLECGLSKWLKCSIMYDSMCAARLDKRLGGE